jgi:hypothetical protein
MVVNPRTTPNHWFKPKGHGWLCRNKKIRNPNIEILNKFSNSNIKCSRLNHEYGARGRADIAAI